MPRCYDRLRFGAQVKGYEKHAEILSENEDLQAEYDSWLNARRRFIIAKNDQTSEAYREGWEKLYLRGRLPNSTKPDDHQIKISLSEFSRKS